jgi:hypothetical protein
VSGQRTTHRKVQTARGTFEVTRRPAGAAPRGLVDKDQPTILISGPGVFELMGRWSTLCGVPDGNGGKVTVNALDATDEQIVWALTHDESIYAERPGGGRHDAD